MDPTDADRAHEAEQRAERAKASLLSRVETLKHKLSDAKDKLNDAKHFLDLPEQISKHALPAVGIAFALGVAAGLRRGSSASGGGEIVRGALWSAFAALGMRALREVAMAQLGRLARQWWDEHGEHALASGPPPIPDGSSRFVDR